MSARDGWNFLNSNDSSYFGEDGSWGYKNPDGSGAFFGPDGGWGYTKPDGSGSYYDDNGGWGFKNSDGTGSVYGGDGSGGFINPDGSGFFYDPNEDSSYNCSTHNNPTRNKTDDLSEVTDSFVSAGNSIAYLISCISDMEKKDRDYYNEQAKLLAKSGLFCAECNGPLSSNSKFCPTCGRKITLCKATCKQCGHTLRDAAKFCSMCGCPVEQS